VFPSSSDDVLGQQARPNHIVQFYEDDDFLCEAVAQFLAAGLLEGEPVCVIATEAHREELAARLGRRGLPIDEARARGQLAWLDARETLARFMVGDMPDWRLLTMSWAPSSSSVAAASPCPPCAPTARWSISCGATGTSRRR
jgi:hypothetical protein